jgi:hypothetical protein
LTATPEDIPTDLTLEIGSDLSPDRFMAVARAFFGVVQEIAFAIAPANEAPKWTVRVRGGSALIGVEPAPSTPPEVLNAIYNRTAVGIEEVARGDIKDSELPDAALKHLRTLAEATESKRAPVPMRVWVRHKPIALEPRIADVIREDWRADYSDYGTVEGRLETIQDKEGSLQLQVRDAVLRQTVRCYFPEEMLPEVFEKFRKRVEITGLIHYRANGVPISIEAASIDTLPDDDELPTPEDVRGILRIAT